MAISNTKVVDTTSKYIVKSTGIKNETDQVIVNGEELKELRFSPSLLPENLAVDSTAVPVI